LLAFTPAPAKTTKELTGSGLILPPVLIAEFVSKSVPWKGQLCLRNDPICNVRPNKRPNKHGGSMVDRVGLIDRAHQCHSAQYRQPISLAQWLLGSGAIDPAQNRATQQGNNREIMA
jgi:hypothetical protein